MSSFDGSTFKVLVDAVEVAFADNSVTWKIGRNSVDERDAPPRVVWVPVDGVFAPPSPRQNVEWEHENKVYLAEHFLDNVLRVHAYLWAEDFAKYEQLQDRVLSAVDDTFATASQPGAYDIATQNDRASIVTRGHAGKLQFSWRLRVCRFDLTCVDELGSYVPMRALVKVAHQTHACKLYPATAKFPPSD